MIGVIAYIVLVYTATGIPLAHWSHRYWRPW